MANEIKTIAVLTSGGDAPGMNAAIRSVVRTAIYRGLKVKGIKKGYNGLLNEDIIDMEPRNVSDIIQKGGTVLGTARCLEFKKQEYQKQAADICRKHGIGTKVGTVDVGVRVEVRDEIMEFLNENLYEAKLVYHTPTFDVTVGAGAHILHQSVR